ncbi:MAG TPA: type III pantothenate kinase [Candidatus Cloacimonadota bacterium]|nr:type III pantothenate kinase [Candidatus Cloacimonadota bacterium]
MRVIDKETAILVVDIGNTSLTCGVYYGDMLVWHTRMQSLKEKTSDEYFSVIKSLLDDKYLSKIKFVAFASVVPEMTRIWMHLCQKYLKAEIYLINAYSDLGIKYLVSDPGFIGADLVVNAYAALQKYHTNCIVIDLGTATTVQVIKADGTFEGTVIAPGIKTGSAYLFEKTALLSEIELVAPTKLLGTNTHDAMLSGIIYGHAFMIDSYISAIKRQYASDMELKTIITGGMSDLVAPILSFINHVDKTITLDGTYLALKRLHEISKD